MKTSETIETGNNGHLDLEKLAEVLGADDKWHEDSDITIQEKLGVFQRLVTAVLKDEEYRQVLLLAIFRDERQANLCCAAIAQCQRYSASISKIVDRVIAQTGIDGRRIKEIILGINTQTFNTNIPAAKLPFWKRKQNNDSLGSSD